ncbi:MAG TPA: hypothetical protein DCM87_22400 [Planctomycetes bacterium]|nr:hypothetical protein [Planctomycetota bacterium]
MEPRAQATPVIVLDAGKVLVDFDLARLFGELSRRAGRAVGPPLPPAFARLLHDVEIGARPWTEIPPAVGDALGIAVTAEEWRALWLGIFTGEVPGMRAALAELKAGYTLVALSNTSQVHWEHVVARYPVFGLLDGWVVSYAERAAKPDPAVYRAVMERWCGGGPPRFYTDDMPRFVEAARALGWDAEVFAGAGAFRRALARRGLRARARIT